MTSGVAEVYGQWLDHLVTADPAEASPPPSLADVLSNLGESDPRLVALARYFAAREQEGAEPADAEAEPDASRAEAVDVPDVLRKLTAELGELRTRNDDLAAALGACYLCWGEDAACAHCDGRGRPGSSRPHPESFVRWVAPAVRRVRSARRSTQVVPVATGHEARPERSTDE